MQGNIDQILIIFFLCTHLERILQLYDLDASVLFLITVHHIADDPSCCLLVHTDGSGDPGQFYGTAIAKSIASIAASVSLIFTQSSSFLLLHIDLCILWFIFRKFCKVLPCIRVCLYFNRDIVKQPVLLHMDMSHFHQFQYG